MIRRPLSLVSKWVQGTAIERRKRSADLRRQRRGAPACRRISATGCRTMRKTTSRPSTMTGTLIWRGCRQGTRAPQGHSEPLGGVVVASDENSAPRDVSDGEEGENAKDSECDDHNDTLLSSAAICAAPHIRFPGEFLFPIWGSQGVSGTCLKNPRRIIAGAPASALMFAIRDSLTQ